MPGPLPRSLGNGVPVETASDDQFLFECLAENCGNLGWKGETCRPDRWLAYD